MIVLPDFSLVRNKQCTGFSLEKCIESSTWLALSLQPHVYSAAVCWNRFRRVQCCVDWSVEGSIPVMAAAQCFSLLVAWVAPAPEAR